ncbi:MAG: hypothetical protein LV477_06945 [Candidatus Nitrosotalea sp.]|nr:hypothetical protein [Candidatus Nitrosotalea sp.]
MKFLYFSILHGIIIFLSMLIFSIGPASADSQKYYGELSPPPFKFIPDNASSLGTVIMQGNYVQFPLHITLDDNYRMDAVELYMDTLPTNVQGWIDPLSLLTRFNDEHTVNATISLYVDSNAVPGDYEIPVVGQGVITDLTTGEAIQILNRTIVMNNVPMKDDHEILQRQQESRPTLATFHLKILPNPNTLGINLGNPDNKAITFCLNVTEGQSCSGFIAYQEFPITVYSVNKTNTRLEAENVPQDAWLKIMPTQFVANSSGTSAIMRMFGEMEPFLMNPSDTKIMTVRVISDEGNSAISYLPVIKNQNIAVLRSESEITLQNKMLLNEDGMNQAIFGVVYDPDDISKKTMPVHLSVLGLVNDSKVVSLPSWIETEIPVTTFSLNASMPYYFTIQVNTKSAPVGVHYVAVKEIVGNQNFVSNLQIEVSSPICTGGPGMCGPQPTPQEKQAKTYLNFPFDVTTDSSGNIYVADSGNDRIVKFDPSGNYLMQFGISGNDNGQFMDPRGVAVDKSGNLYVADTTNNRIEKFDSAGKFILKFGTYGTDNGQFHGPYSVTVDKSGSIYVADVGNARIEKFDANGNFILKFGTRGQEKGELDGIERISVDDSDYLYVTSTYQGVQKFDSTGHFVQEISLKPTLDGNDAPDAWGIALAEKGTIYVAGYNQARIQKFDSQGNFEYEFGSFGSQAGEFDHPGNIAADNLGNVLVADSNNNRIEKLDSSGKFVSQIHDWSTAKDLQTIPEFPSEIPIFLIGIVSVIAFYRIKFRK